MNLLKKMKAGLSETAINALDLIGQYKEYDLATRHLDHYRRSHGLPITIPTNQLRKFETIKQSEDINQNRFLSGLNNKVYRKGDPAKTQTSIVTLKDNETAVLQDYFDVDHTNDTYKAIDPDLFYTLGRFKIRSQSQLEFKKSGKSILPYGHVTHQLYNETYDFNPGSKAHLLTAPLEDAGKAKPYQIKSQWKTFPTGVIKIKDNNTLDTSELEWNLLPLD